MRRENRLNLLFLAAFIVVALPGAVILFKKKLDPTAHRLDQPDPILNRLPYMVPPPAPAGIKWIVPDRTQAWVQSLTAPAPVASAKPPGPQWEPVISEDHRLQLLGVTVGDPSHLTLLLWNGTVEPRADLFAVTIDGAPGSAHVTSVKVIAIPPDARRELVMMGFVRPPVNVLVLDVAAQALAPLAKHSLALSYTASSGGFRTSVEFGVPANRLPR
ncbi:MAG TPA: hypothetical protein VIM11_22900 [Tepidisphaeraceae bacterium]|jgi:hypothetical protein